MDRGFFDFLIEQANLKENGTLEACYKVRKFLRQGALNEEGICTDRSVITLEEFKESVETLLAYVWDKQEDSVPEYYKCDQDCTSLDHPDCFCEGEFQIKSSSYNGTAKVRRCPYFKDSGNI